MIGGTEVQTHKHTTAFKCRGKRKTQIALMGALADMIAGFIEFRNKMGVCNVSVLLFLHLKVNTDY